MSDEVEITVEGRAGIITLAREKAINALSGEMIAQIDLALAQWANDDDIALVLIEGRGDKGFCAGGDVRAVRQSVLDGNTADAQAYFAQEYRMNARISGYQKPLVAIQHGFVMGGGVGLSSHARYRIATQSARFAMPEAAIGFFCDVGVNAILYQTAEHRALAFLMGGLSVGAADAIALGLCDASISDAGREELRSKVIEAASALDPDTALAGVIASLAIDPGEAQFCALADTLRLAFENQPAPDILANLSSLAGEGDPGASALFQAMAQHCPTSLAVIAASHRLSRKLRDVSAILSLDAALAGFMVSRPDFAEGVRAVLVDKDRTPRWVPDRMDAIDAVALADVLANHHKGAQNRAAP